MKTESLVESGRGATALLSFKHERFRRDSPDLLGQVVIVSQRNETPQIPGNKLLSASVETLERKLEKMKAEMKQIKNQSRDQEKRIDHLRQEVASKDENIRHLEFRLERLENTVLMASNPAPNRYQSLGTNDGIQKSKTEEPFSTTLRPLKSFTGSGLALKERDISAMDLFPLLEEPHPSCNEPTLPRSKRMKYCHQGKIFNDGCLDRFTLSRQSTPVLWGFPCL